MAYTGQRARVDANHKDIVTKLRQYPNITVRSVATIKGFCDIIVGYNNTNYLYEIKDPNKPPSARKLTPDEIKFHDEWKGHVKIALTTEDILKDINYKRSK
jgi:hypothetical protein